MSYDADVAYMLSKPISTQSTLVQDEGVLLTTRCDAETFRADFLKSFHENQYVKTFVSEFLVLQKSIVFDNKGRRFKEDWYLKNRDRLNESDPAKIPIIMPKEWVEDAKALKRYFGRVNRQNETQNRAPKLGSIKDTFVPDQNLGNFSTPTITPDYDSEIGERYTILPTFNNPQSHGSMSFEHK